MSKGHARTFLVLALVLLAFRAQRLMAGTSTLDGTIQMNAYGTTADGQQVDQYTLTHGRLTAKIITYGGLITELVVPDRDGKPGDIVLGFDTLDGYLGEHPYFGALVGRYANRIAGGKFSLEGQDYTLAQNNGPNALHGGLKGFDKRVWKAKAQERPEGPSLELSYRSVDGEEGYPGVLEAVVTYTLTEDSLRIDYLAQATKPTPVNLTNHTYFNLSGAAAGTILDHVLMVNADAYTPVDDTLIPTGEIAPVKGTPLDFTTATPIGQRIDQMTGDPSGYDHNLVLRGGITEEPRLAVRVKDPKSGRVLEMLTTEPGVQFYTGNFLDGTNVGKGGVTYRKNQGFCLEAQHYPDSPNQPAFPDAFLRPGATYRQTTIYRFSTE